MLGEECLVHSKRKHSLRCLTWSEFYCLKRGDIESVVMANYKNGHKIWNRMRLKIKVAERESNGYRKLRNLSDVPVLNSLSRMESKQMVHDLSHEALEMHSLMAFEPMARKSRAMATSRAGINYNPLTVIEDDGYVLMTSNSAELKKIEDIRTELQNNHSGRTVRIESTAAGRNQEVLERTSVWEYVDPESLCTTDQLIDTDDSSQGSDTLDNFQMIELKRLKTKTGFL